VNVIAAVFCFIRPGGFAGVPGSETETKSLQKDPPWQRSLKITAIPGIKVFSNPYDHSFFCGRFIP
jgi:hypothetical protein